jgi:hypothetical protein
MDTGWIPPGQAQVLATILNLAVTPSLPYRAEVIEIRLRHAIGSNRVQAAA